TDVTDSRGIVRRLGFNGDGQALTDTRAYGTAIAQTTTYERQATTNLVAAMTDALNRRTELTYDGQGNVLTVPRRRRVFRMIATRSNSAGASKIDVTCSPAVVWQHGLAGAHYFRAWEEWREALHQRPPDRSQRYLGVPRVRKRRGDPSGLPRFGAGRY